MISLNLNSHISITCLKNGFIKCPSPLFSSVPQFPWHFCHLSPLHNKDLEKAARSLQFPRSRYGKPFPAWNEPLSALYCILWAGKKMERMGEGGVPARASSWLGRGVPGRCFLGCLCVFQENSSQSRCFTVGELLLRLQLRNTFQTANEASVLGLKRCSFDPGNDSQYSKNLIIYIHLRFILKKGIQGALWKCLQNVNHPIIDGKPVSRDLGI